MPWALGRTLPDRPGGLLWELRLLTESGSGRRSLLLSVHHALVDGVSVGLLMRLLCDGGPGSLSPARVDGSVTVSGRIRPSPARAAVLLPALLRGLPGPARGHGAESEPFSCTSRLAQAVRVDERVVVEAREALPAGRASVSQVMLAAMAGALRSVPAVLGPRPRLDGVVVAVPVDLRGAFGLGGRLGRSLCSLRSPIG